MGKRFGRHKKIDPSKITSLSSNKSCDHAGAYESSSSVINGTKVTYWYCSCGAAFSTYE